MTDDSIKHCGFPRSGHLMVMSNQGLCITNLSGDLSLPAVGSMYNGVGEVWRR